MTDSSSPFLDRLHRTFGIPVSIVMDLVDKATHHRPVTIDRVVDGYDNEVYRADIGDRTVFVRIKRFGEEPTFDGELWAMDSARAAGVPAPEVLLVDQVPTAEGERPVMILAAAHGLAINATPGLTHADRATALQNAGHTLGRLHTVTTPGFWRPAEDGSWPIQDWRALMEGFVADRAAERDIIVSIGFTSAEVDHMIDLMHLYARDFPCTSPVLCHGDFTPGHIFVDAALQVSGVIDFGMYGGGPPAGDLALINFNLPERDLEDVLTGYANPDPEFRRAIDLHTIGLAIGHLAHHASIGDDRGIHDGAASLQATLRRLEAGLRTLAWPSDECPTGAERTDRLWSCCAEQSK